MNIQTFIETLSRNEATRFRKTLACELGISTSYARHLCNGVRAIPLRHAGVFEQLTRGSVTRFDIVQQKKWLAKEERENG